MNIKEKKQEFLNKLYEPYKKCVQCPLGTAGRKNVVFGEGNPDADLMFIGEAPGRDEDELSRPFVGMSGQLLNKALEIAGIDRKEIFITNIVKCRPPNNRLPTEIESSTCKGILLYNQIKIIKPKIICTLGSHALNSLLITQKGEPLKITKVRGQVIQKDKIKILPIYHPAYILRNRTQLSTFVNDIKLAKELIDTEK